LELKVKLSLCFNWPPRHEGVLESGVYLHAFLTSALDGGGWSASSPGRFTSRERAAGNHWIGGWVDPRVGLDAVVQRKRDKVLIIISTIAYNYMMLQYTEM
jgi:hypothetical protein